MSWARIDDGFHDHPKVEDLSLAAVGLWTLCLSAAHRHRKTAVIPGYISEGRVRKLAGEQAFPLSSELMEARLWEPEVNLGGYVIHDFLDYAPRDRDAGERRDAGRRGAAKRWEGNGKHDGNSDGNSDGNLPSDVMASGMVKDGSRAGAGAPAPAFPSRPVKELTTKNSCSAKPSTPDRFDEFWSIYPKRVAKQAAIKRWSALVQQGVDPADIIAGAKLYADRCRGTDPKFVKQAPGWLSDGRYEDEPPRTAPSRPSTPWAGS